MILRMKVDSTRVRGLLLVALCSVFLLTSAGGAWAGPRRLQRPPDVEIDPDRWMTFGRLPKTSFDRRVFGAMQQALDSRVMDPAIDPYNQVFRPNRYEPGSGKIRDSLTDKVREIRRAQEARRTRREEAARQTYGRRAVIGATGKKSSSD
jgi:hypothetical protein